MRQLERLLLATLLALPMTASAQVTDACFDALKLFIPNEFRKNSWNSTLEKFHSLVCTESQEASNRRKESGFKFGILIPGSDINLGMDLSNQEDEYEERRKQACAQKDKHLDQRAVFQLFVRTNADLLEGLKICNSGRAALEVDSQLLAGSSLIQVTVRRPVAGHATIERIFTPNGFGDCTLPTALPERLDALEQYVFTCGYSRAKGSAAFIQTSSIGTFPATAPPTKIFTLQTDTTTYQPKQIGWTQETCKKTCNAHDRSPCDTTVKISNRERGVTLKEPHRARCAQPRLGRCKWYARPHQPVFALDGSWVTQKWTLRSRRTRVCLKVMRYKSIPDVRIDKDRIELGPRWSTLPRTGGDHVLIDAEGTSHKLSDEIFERDKDGRIRLKS